MKLAFTVRVPEKTECLRDFYFKVKYLAELGYDGVELAVRDPKKINVKKVKEIIDNFGMKVPTISTGEAYTKDGLSLSDIGPGSLEYVEAIERIKGQVDFAANFNSRVTIGLVRGWFNEKYRDTSIRVFSNAVHICAQFAKEQNIVLLIEPLNRYETNFINTLQEAKNFISELKTDNVYILADTYHMNIEEKSITGSIIENKGLISHIHFADNNRLAPGQGHIDFLTILQTLKKINYKGFITTEINLKPDFETAAFKTIKYLQPMINFWRDANEKRN